MSYWENESCATPRCQLKPSSSVATDSDQLYRISVVSKSQVDAEKKRKICFNIQHGQNRMDEILESTGCCCRCRNQTQIAVCREEVVSSNVLLYSQSTQVSYAVESFSHYLYSFQATLLSTQRQLLYHGHCSVLPTVVSLVILRWSQRCTSLFRKQPRQIER